MGDGTAYRAAGVRLKIMRGSRLRCVMNRTDNDFFLFGPVKPLENLGFSEKRGAGNNHVYRSLKSAPQDLRPTVETPFRGDESRLSFYFWQRFQLVANSIKLIYVGVFG